MIAPHALPTGQLVASYLGHYQKRGARMFFDNFINGSYCLFEMIRCTFVINLVLQDCNWHQTGQAAGVHNFKIKL